MAAAHPVAPPPVPAPGAASAPGPPDASARVPAAAKPGSSSSWLQGERRRCDCWGPGVGERRRLPNWLRENRGARAAHHHTSHEAPSSAGCGGVPRRLPGHCRPRSPPAPRPAQAEHLPLPPPRAGVLGGRSVKRGPVSGRLPVGRSQRGTQRKERGKLPQPLLWYEHALPWVPHAGCGCKPPPSPAAAAAAAAAVLELELELELAAAGAQPPVMLQHAACFAAAVFPAVWACTPGVPPWLERQRERVGRGVGRA